MFTYFCRLGKREKGQSLVEFALVLPILLLLILGIVDFGMAFYGLVTVNTAAREGARRGVLEGKDKDDVINAAYKTVKTLPDLQGLDDITTKGKLKMEINGKEVYPNDNAEFPDSGEDLTVLVSYKYDLITPLPAFLPAFINIEDNRLTLKGQISMVRE